LIAKYFDVLDVDTQTMRGYKSKYENHINSRVVRASVLAKPLVESLGDAVVPPRSQKVIGSIPIGGSTKTARSEAKSSARALRLSRPRGMVRGTNGT
jgi:hypothetical protein